MSKHFDRVYEVEMNYRWFKNYHDILKSIYHEGHIVIVKREVKFCSDSKKKCLDWALANTKGFGHFSIEYIL
jgi:hypothetical protein